MKSEVELCKIVPDLDGSIAKWVCDILPNANTLYDLFAGGGVITHCASLNQKYNNYIVNDLNSLCINGLKMKHDG